MKRLWTATLERGKHIIGRVIGRHGSRTLTDASLAIAERSALNRGEHVVDQHQVAGPTAAAPPRPAPTKPKPVPMSPGRRAVELAKLHLGEHETPPGSNEGPLPDKVNANAGAHGAQWCASFATWIWQQVGIEVPGGATDSCAGLRIAAQKAGRWSPTPVVGAIGIVAGDKHAVLVESIAALTIDDVSGNTDETNGTNYAGGYVAEHTHQRAIFSGYVLPCGVQ